LDRTACVDLPAFPLQLLQKRRAECTGLPTVVVEEDKPLARVLWTCERARARGILPGFRYGQALSLCAELRAGVVSPAEIDAGVAEMAGVLRKLSPDVEPCRSEPGVFWLSGAGLRRVFSSASAWGRATLAAVGEADFTAGVAVGFSRFATYAVARAAPKLTIFRDEAAELRAARSVPLDRLSLDPALRDTVGRLGVHTLGGYLSLPPGGVLLRFGREAFRLHELAAGASWDPLRPDRPEPPLATRLDLDDPESDATRLLFLIKSALQKLLGELAGRKLALSALRFSLSFSRAFGEQEERLEPAAPTLDERVLMRLVQLRLEASPPRAAVIGLSLFAEAVPAHASQLALFLQGPRRDLHAASEALAQLRAELGDAAVRKATLRDGHLPEAQFSWEPLVELPVARPRPASQRVLVRRIHERPLPVQAYGAGFAGDGRSAHARSIDGGAGFAGDGRSAHARSIGGGVGSLRDDGWIIAGLEHGAVLRYHGPYLASGGWWGQPREGLPRESGEARAGEARAAARVAISDGQARDYGFADTRRGECLWVFYDRARRQWFIQGAVE
jgi:protein ImuB